jgi:hypothetical protein
MPKSYTIFFSVSKGDFYYHKNEILTVNPGDSVEWKCKDGYAFAVHIGRGSPLAKGRFRARAGGLISTVIPKNPRDKYMKIVKYTIAVFDGENVWSDDPLIIIRKPSG